MGLRIPQRLDSAPSAARPCNEISLSFQTDSESDKAHSVARASTPLEHPYCVGYENPGEFKNVIKGLVRDGYSDNEIIKVMGLNGMRVIKEWLTWTLAESLGYKY